MTEEIVDGVAWSTELRASVYPSRRLPNPAFRDMLLEGMSLKHPISPKAARVAAAYYWKENKRDIERAKTGLAKNPPAWRPAVEAALARCKRGNQSGPLDIDLEAATVTLELCPLFAAMPYWLSAGGIPFALRTLIRCHEIAGYAKEFGYTDAGNWILETRDYSVDRPEDNAGEWALLRAMLSDAIEPVYDEAHGIADEARLRTAGGTPNQSGLQLMIPFAFPDEKAWAKDGAAAALGLAKQAKSGHTPGLAYYTTVAPLDTTIELLGCTVNTAFDSGELMTIIAHAGADAGLRVIAAGVDKAANEEQRKMWCEMLLAIRTPDAAKLFERLARRGKTFSKYAQRYWQLVVPEKPSKKLRTMSAKKRAARSR